MIRLLAPLCALLVLVALLWAAAVGGMDLTDLDAIKARCEAATPGPWEPDGSEVFVAQSREWVAESLRSGDGYPQGVTDAALIAHARTDVPALVAEVERWTQLAAAVSAS